MLPTIIGELYAPEFLALIVVAVKVAESSGLQSCSSSCQSAASY